MARGWESKSVEAQMEAAAATPAEHGSKLTPEQQRRRRQRETLRLARARVLQQLSASHDDRYTEMLRTTLADLDRQIAGLHS